MELEASASQVNRDGSTFLLIIIVLVLYLAVGGALLPAKERTATSNGRMQRGSRRIKEMRVSLSRRRFTMSNKDKVKNMLQILRGKTKRSVGSVTHDKGLKADGENDERIGNMKQAGEKVKDALRED
jgi:uncharacterized protein YjbJ (UPF0337 family)